MVADRAPAGASLADVLDRVVDKGIVIDAYIGVNLVGIDLVTIEARIVVASVESYLRNVDRIRAAGMVSRPLARGEDSSRLGVEDLEPRQTLSDSDHQEFRWIHHRDRED